MTKKDMLKKGKNADVLDNATLRHGLQLSEVKFDAVTKLQRNPQNSVFFRTETAEYFRRLREDIQARGILVPLIAKLDGTLLAGHNRLQVALELGLKQVPVQYVLDTLSPNDEKIFVVKDNLLRRQFTYDEWTAIFREVIPNYEKRIFDESRGRKSKELSASEKKKLKNGQVSELSKKASAEKKSSATKTSLTQEIAQKTGLNERTIRRINEAARKNAQSASATNNNQSSRKITPNSKQSKKQDLQEKQTQENIRQAKTLVREIDGLLSSIPEKQRSSVIAGFQKVLAKYTIA